MARPATLLAAALALCLLLAPTGLAWYKPAAGPSLYSVGRAAGLLSGLRRSLDARRAESPVGAGPPGRAAAFPELRPSLRSLVSVSASARGAGRRRILCVKDVTPNLQSCERLPDGHATFQCKADVFLSLRAADCRST